MLYKAIIRSAVRVPDPWVQLRGQWIVRRSRPIVSRVELASLPKDRDELRLLRAMGQETAERSSRRPAGDGSSPADDLERRPSKWLLKAAQEVRSRDRRRLEGVGETAGAKNALAVAKQ